MKHPAFFQYLYLNKFYGETIKDKNLLSIFFLLPISFLQNIFASQYSFLPSNDFLLAKHSPKILLAKFPPQKNMLLQNRLPKISSQENFFQKKNCSAFCSPNFHHKEFAPQIFPLKNFFQKKNCSAFCSPNFHHKEFAPQIFPLKNLRICCQTFLVSIFLLTMKFYLQKIFLLAKFPPHK